MIITDYFYIRESVDLIFFLIRKVFIMIIYEYEGEKNSLFVGSILKSHNINIIVSRPKMMFENHISIIEKARDLNQSF